MDLFQKNEANSAEFTINYLNDIWNNVLKGETGFAFFNSSEQEFSEYITNYLDDLTENKVVLREKIKKNNYDNPYYPFLDFIKEQLKGMNELDSYLEEVGVYQLQKLVLLKFLQGQKTKRKEEVILEEIEYEKQQMLSSLTKLLEKTSELNPVIIVIENLHWADLSTLRLIKYLMKNSYKGKIMFIFSFAQDIRLVGQNQEEWEDFLDKVRSQQMIIDLKSSIGIKNNQISNEDSTVLEIEELINLSNDCLNFLALKKAKKYITEAYERYQNNNENLTTEYYIEMINLLGDIHNYLDENGNALIYYQSITNYLQQNRKTKELSDIYRKISLIHFKKYNMKTADKLANRSLKLAQEVEDEVQIFKTYFLIVLIEEKRRVYTKEKGERIYKQLIALGKKLDFDNTLARCYFAYFYIVNDYGSSKAVTYCNEMINLAKNYNNEYRLSVAYHIKGVLYKRKKKYDQVLEYYNKSKKLKEKIGDQSSLAIIYNGIGSFHFLVENYEQAYDYYNQALDSLRITKDYHEIGMTCYNLALTLFFAQEYEEAIFYLNKIIDILKESQVKKLLYHTKIRIYILLGINYLKIGNFNKVQECIIKIDNRSIKDTTGEARNNLDFFLLEFLTALIFKAESNYQEAEKHFDWAIKLCNDIEENNQYLYPKLYYEYGLMCEELGSVEKANNLFKRGLKYCKKLEYNFYKGLILSEINREPVKIDKFNFSKSNFDFDWIPESVELEETLDKLYQQMDKINFLNNLQNTLMKTSDNKDLAEKTMELIEDNFLIEANYLYLKEEGTWKNYFTNDEEVNFDFDVQKFINLLIAEGTERIILNPRQDYSQEVVGNFNSLIFVPLESETEVIGCIICATISKELVLSNDSLKILSIVAKQLSIALERIERNQELKDAYQQLLVSSKTDSLTGVYNRWELRNKLESEMERSRRYGKKYAVLFIDLDNFKYYNDEFGHDIGDLVLCEFAKLLEESVRKTDFVSRFGGDEFVLVLPETTADKAYLLAERIQNRLIEVNHFQPVIEKEIGEKIEIPPKIN